MMFVLRKGIFRPVWKGSRVQSLIASLLSMQTRFFGRIASEGLSSRGFVAGRRLDEIGWYSLGRISSNRSRCCRTCAQSSALRSVWRKSLLPIVRRFVIGLLSTLTRTSHVRLGWRSSASFEAVPKNQGHSLQGP